MKSLIKKLSPVAWLIVAAAFVKLLIHLLTGANYGFFLDELYTIDLSKHLDFGYMDLPPLVPLLTSGSRFLFGESLFAYHIMPALAGAFTLVFACLFVRELGGRFFAVGLTALAVIASPVWLYFSSLLCYDAIDQLALTAFLFYTARFLRTGDKGLWLAIGLTAGIAFMTKATIFFLGPGFVIAILASKQRRQLLSPWPWMAVGVFLVLAAPWVIWNYVNHWPTIRYWSNYGRVRVYRYSFVEYLRNAAVTMGFALVPFIVAGLYRIFRRFSDTSFRLFGIMFLSTFVIVFLLRTRTIILAELCIPLIAATAVWMEQALRKSVWTRTVRIAAVSVLLAGGIVEAPLWIPILPESSLPAYAKAMSRLHKDPKDFNFELEFPQSLTGRIGWEDLVKAVAEVYDSLPADDRAQAGIMVDWFGPAGAIDLLGKPYGLPTALCNHLTYHRWGPGPGSWDVMIYVSSGPDVPPRMYFSDITLAATVKKRPMRLGGMEYGIFVCRSPNAPPALLWSASQQY